jgi:hypothetical protein
MEKPINIHLGLSKVITEGKDCPKCGSFHCTEDGLSACEIHPFGFTWSECQECGELFNF